MRQPQEFPYDVFLSHSTKDKATARVNVHTVATSNLTNATATMKDIPNEIGIVARRMKAPIPVGPPLHQVKKLIDLLEERKSTQPKFTPQRMEHWQKNHDRLIAIKARLESQSS